MCRFSYPKPTRKNHNPFISFEKLSCKDLRERSGKSTGIAEKNIRNRTVRETVSETPESAEAD
jgi:hypothetical protein